MIRRFVKRVRRSERGATIIEFAFAVPILFAFIFGIIEFAWVLHGYITLSGAVREGARLAVVSSYSEDNMVDLETAVQDAVIKHARILEIERSDIKIDPELGSGNYKEETSVKVTEANLPLLTGIIGKEHVITNLEASMMHE